MFCREFSQRNKYGELPHYSIQANTHPCDQALEFPKSCDPDFRKLHWKSQRIFPGDFPGEIRGPSHVSGKKQLITSAAGRHPSSRELIRRTINELRIVREVCRAPEIIYFRNRKFQFQFRWSTEDGEKFGKFVFGGWGREALWIEKESFRFRFRLTGYAEGGQISQ